MTTVQIVVLGMGYVGLTTAVGLASTGHHVTGVDSDGDKISTLLQGESHLHEPGLERRLCETLRTNKLDFSTCIASNVSTARFVFLCLPTPQYAEGCADISAVWAAVRAAKPHLRPGCVTIIRSTVPIGTARAVSDYVRDVPVKVAANPEFLREGHAIEDFLNPHRIVVGADDRRVAERVAALYHGISSSVYMTNAASAELAKYAANAFLALRLSFVNMVAEFCENIEARTDDVLAIIGADPRIGTAYLRPGPGWGGPCLPKDTSELIHFAESADAEHSLLRAIVQMNQRQPHRIAESLRDALDGTLRDRRIALFGLAFKAGTGDVRGSPALPVARLLVADGALLAAYDPLTTTDPSVPGLTVTHDPYRAADSADAVLLLTDSPEFNDLDWVHIACVMAGTRVLDTRACLDPKQLRNAGLYHQIQWRRPRVTRGYPPIDGQ